ncbi:MAG: exopolysaccharide biosynthesis protein [Pseudomonadota bacterium]
MRRCESDDDGVIHFEELVEALGQWLYGPMFLIAALLQLLPTGLITGVTGVVTTIALLIGIQMVIRCQHPWIPNCLLKVSTSQKTPALGAYF